MKRPIILMCVGVFFSIFILAFSCLGLETMPSPDIGLVEPGPVHADPGHWVILDGRPRSEWEKGHIPGALSFSWESYTRTDEKKIAWRVFTPEELAEVLGKMGMDENSPVAAYGDMDTSWGGEAWLCWVLSWLGHKGPIRLMNGGLDAWKEAGFSVSGEASSRSEAPKTYHLGLRNELNISAKAIYQRNTKTFIVDTRSFREWITGDRLPEAVHINWKNFFSGKNHILIDGTQLARLLKDNDVDINKPVIYYCTGGIRSSVAWLVHTLSRRGIPVNFEGGTEEWIRSR